MAPIDWTKLPSLTALRAFESVAQAGSFSAAARTLNVTHAAVAQQVRGLEEYLGMTLVQRSPRGVALTGDGQALAASLRDGFAAIADGVEALRERDKARPIRVTTTAFFAESVIFPHIAAFWRDHPGTEIAFTPSDLAVDLVAEGYDLAVRAGQGDWPGLRVMHLLDSPTLACAAPHLVDDPATDWASLPWLIPNDTVWEREALLDSGIDPASIRTVDVGNPGLEIRAAEEGMGLLLESQADIGPQLAKGSLKVAPVRIAHVSSYFIVTPPWPPRPTVDRFVSWLMALCRAHPSGP